MATSLRVWSVGLPVLVIGLFYDSTARADENDRVLFDFGSEEAAEQWRPVNDDVMGGISEGSFQITEQDALQFFGTLSLENRGGFASVRSRPADLGLKDGDVLLARVRGDGRQYYFNLLVPTWRIAFSYRAPFQTKAGEWQEVKIPLKDFQATSFGRPIKDAAPVDPTKIRALGFLLADKKAGPFKLEVEWIKVQSPPAE